MAFFEAFNKIVGMLSSLMKYIKTQLYLRRLEEFDDAIKKDDIEELRRKLSDPD